jgi:hypothetical protein
MGGDQALGQLCVFACRVVPEGGEVDGMFVQGNDPAVGEGECFSWRTLFSEIGSKGDGTVSDVEGGLLLPLPYALSESNTDGGSGEKSDAGDAVRAPGGVGSGLFVDGDFRKGLFGDGDGKNNGLGFRDDVGGKTPFAIGLSRGLGVKGEVEDEKLVLLILNSCTSLITSSIDILSSFGFQHDMQISQTLSSISNGLAGKIPKPTIE